MANQTNSTEIIEANQASVDIGRISGDQKGIIAAVAKDNIIVGDNSQLVINKAVEIDWDRVDFTAHLKRVGQLFLDHMRLQGDALTEDDALKRYLPLHLSALQTKQEHQETTTSTRQGTWETLAKEGLVGHPHLSLLLGEAGLGKTTQLLYLAQGLAEKAIVDEEAPIPIYLPLTSFRGDTTTLLDMAAYTSGQEPKVLHALWHARWRDGETHPALYLILDGADEVPETRVPEVIAALKGLLNAGPAHRHSLLLASRPGIFQETLQRRLPDAFQEIIVLPLDDEEIEALLTKHKAAALTAIVNRNQVLKDIMRAPGLLTAMAQSIQEIQRTGRLENVGQLHHFHIDFNLFGIEGRYKYWEVQRPLLAWLAFHMLSHGESSLPLDEALYAQLAERLAAIAARHERRRVVMPPDWSAETFIDDLLTCPVLSAEQEPEPRFWFKNRLYRDFFATAHLTAMEATSSSEWEAMVTTFEPEQWIDPLLFLIGYQPEATATFDRLFASRRQLASDLWFEKPTYGVATPPSIQAHYEAKRAALDAAFAAALPDHLTERLISELQDADDPRQRLKAAGALSQWGAHAIPYLLYAADDDHPLVRAVAHYALLHLGETQSPTEPERPLPPLIEITDREGLRFRSVGGSNARIGPMTLVDVPRQVIAELDLQMDTLDFDPFEAPCRFEHWSFSAAWLAASWFETRQSVDWTGLIARLHWIATWSAEAAKWLEDRQKNTLADDLTYLMKELTLRAVQCNSLGKKLARDLGLAWQAVSIEDVLWEENTEATYQQLRYLYSQTNRTRFLSMGKDRATVSTMEAIEQSQARAFDGQSSSQWGYVPPRDLPSIALAMEKEGRLGNARNVALAIPDRPSQIECLQNLVHTLLNKKRFDEAWRTALAIQNPHHRNVTLQDIAQSLARMGWIRKARDVLSAMQHRADWPIMLVQLAQGLAEKNPEKAEGLIREALRKAEALRDETVRYRVLYGIWFFLNRSPMTELAETTFQQTLKAAWAIPDPTLRWKPLLTSAMTMMNKIEGKAMNPMALMSGGAMSPIGTFKEVGDTIKRMNNPRTQALALRDVARSIAEAEAGTPLDVFIKPKIIEAIDHALVQAKTFSDPWVRSLAFANLAQPRAKLGGFENDAQFEQFVNDIVAEVRDEAVCSQTLLEVAMTLLRGRLSNLGWAQQAIAAIPDEALRSKAYYELIRVTVETEKALALASIIPDAEWRTRALMELAEQERTEKALYEQAYDAAWAIADPIVRSELLDQLILGFMLFCAPFEEALGWVTAIPDDAQRGETIKKLMSFGVHVAQGGEKDVDGQAEKMILTAEAEAVIEQARDAVQAIPDEAVRYEALLNLGMELMILADLGIARTFFDEAYHTARAIPDEAVRYQFLLKTGQVLMALPDQFERAQVIFEEALEAAMSISDEAARTEARRHVAAILVDLAEMQADSVYEETDTPSTQETEPDTDLETVPTKTSDTSILTTPDAVSHTDDFNFLLLNYASKVRRIEGDFSGVTINKVVGANQQIPIGLLIKGNLWIGHVKPETENDEVDVSVVRINTVEGHGLRVVCRVHIEAFTASRLQGIVAESGTYDTMAEAMLAEGKRRMKGEPEPG